jgi:hypothetical protein
MTIIVFGFRTAAAAEVPEILYIGDDGDKALKIANESDYPRVARVVNPTLLPVRHWTEEASETFEKEHGKKLGQPVITDIFGKFTVEEAPVEQLTPAESKEAATLLNNLTVDELKELAAEEEVDVSGCKLKQDFIDAISAHRSAKAEPE